MEHNGYQMMTIRTRRNRL